MTDEIVAFIRARLDEDEQGALNAHERDWRPDGANSCQVYVARADGSNRTIAWCRNGYDDDFANALHIARHDPARVLREVEAGRGLVQAYGEAEAWYAAHPAAPAGEVQGLWTAVRMLAGHWSDHPDFREEWRVAP